MTRLFFSYSHADEDLRDMLETHLSALKHQGLIETWHDRRILPGDELDDAIAENLETADIILLLISAKFIDSSYCYSVEMKRAMERHEAGEARVVPVILRSCDWHDMPFGGLMATPTDGRPVKSWPDLDEAFLDVVNSIKRAVKELRVPTVEDAPEVSSSVSSPAAVPVKRASDMPRSSNLRTRKTFTDADKDTFLDSAFEHMSSFFENSLSELQARNADVSSRFRRIDGNRFTAVIYRNGEAVSRCKVVLGGMFGKGITYSANDQANDNSCNENLYVENDDQSLYLKPMGMPAGTARSEAHLTPEGASEYYWSMLIGPLQ